MNNLIFKKLLRKGRESGGKMGGAWRREPPEKGGKGLVFEGVYKTGDAKK